MLPVILHAIEADTIERYIDQMAEENEIPSHNRMTVVLLPKKKEISVDQMREVNRELTKSPAVKRLIIVHAFDSSSEEAQNALLKTLEEKRAHQYFVLQVTNPNRVLPTIRSRSTLVQLQVKSTPEADTETAAFFELVTGTGYGFLSHPLATATTADKALESIDRLLSHMRVHVLASHPAGPTLLLQMLQVRGLIVNNNAHPQLSLDSLLLTIHDSLSR